MGDWNSVVGKVKEGRATGEYERGVRNLRGNDSLNSILNSTSWFKQHKSMLYLEEALRHVGTIPTS